MTGLKETFADEADFDLGYNIEQAFRMTSPNFRGFMAALADGMAMDFADEVYKYLRGKVGQTDSPVPGILVPVPPLEEQIALDRRQFPALDEGGRADTGKLIFNARNAARPLLKSLMDNPGLKDEEKLLLIQHVRLHLYSVMVYRDRLKNSAPAAAPGITPPAAG